jgi:tellurite resistance protein TerC
MPGATLPSMQDHHLLLWLLFNCCVVAMLALDWTVLQRNASGPRAAWVGTSIWVALAAIFGLGIYVWQGRAPAVEFTTAYVVEESLSVDNLFIFLVIFRTFGVPVLAQRKILLWGVLGAMGMRLAFILTGISLIAHFQWVAPFLGAFLLVVGIRAAAKRRTTAESYSKLPAGAWRVVTGKCVRKFFPITDGFEGNSFFVKRERWFATPLLLALLMIEITDLAFALDSIPAVLGITHNAFIAYASNVFAILGLRSLYFVVAGLMNTLRFLPQGISIVLAFVGAKMLLSHYYVVPTEVALSVVIGVLALSVILSLLFRREHPTQI